MEVEIPTSGEGLEKRRIVLMKEGKKFPSCGREVKSNTTQRREKGVGFKRRTGRERKRIGRRKDLEY